MLYVQMKSAIIIAQIPKERIYPWWLWPNILSLDAPLIALAWQELWAQCLVVEISWMHRVMLALATWLAYSGDRLLDARRLKGPTESPRHKFSHKHYLLLTKVWFIGLVTVITLGLQLSVLEIINGLILLVVVASYFLIHHWQYTRAFAGSAKEITAGTVFSVGTVFFVMTVSALTSALLLCFASWVGLCVMNCLAIACWDRQRDKVMEQHSLARCWIRADLWLWLWAIAVITLALGAWSMNPRLGPMAVALSLSSVALNELARTEGSDLRRVLADMLLLTPVLLLLF